ncbi:DUF4064 domain-containing protein [Shouchella sp. JSM 1781072]|jgi:hypothetical protein|uniref:DUF4064 domain-containing protein n=1 Tax=Bacillaceae TaxID=186817 RepID=UPI0020D15E48|nr:DUF4064 domain-containing protein [Alkalihalobacillus sp. LMS6]UTR06334.1 DUF4064 domain-containing protein [Alkalihalobacillus sp. LMS6]
MIKRTGERVLGIIGLVMFFLGTLFLGVLAIGDNQGLFEEVFMELTEESSELVESGTDPLTEEEANEVIETFDMINFTMLTIGSLLPAIAGIVAVILLKNKPVIASILFLGSAVFYGATSFLLLAFLIPAVPMILYIIAGIMALVRKPKEPVEQL